MTTVAADLKEPAEPVSGFPLAHCPSDLTASGLTIAEAAAVRRSWLREHLTAQDHRCAYCRRRVAADATGERRATIDHVVARKEGGADARANTVAACLGCNTRKGHGSFAELEVQPWFRIALAEGRSER